MATAKKTGIVAKVKDAITGMFSTDDGKRKPAVKKTAKKAVRAVKKAAKKVTATAKKATSPAKRAAVEKVSTKRSTPGERTKPGTSMDRKLISLSGPYEVRDWCKSLGCTEAQLRAAVGAVGNSAAKVRAHLGEKKVGAF